MSKKNKKQNDIKVENLSNVSEEAIELYLCPLSQSLKIQNLNRLLLLAYLKDSFLKKCVSTNDVLSISLYGNSENFKVLEILPKSDQPLFISKRTQIHLTSLLIEDLNEEVDKIQLNNQKQILISGLDIRLKEINTIIEISIFQKEIFEKSNLSGVKGILICGPPGVGKSSILKKIEMDLPKLRFLEMGCLAMVSKFVGETENKIQELFQLAKSIQPCVISVDDLHIICNKKSMGSQNQAGIINAFVSEIDNLQQSDQVLATTSQITQIDPQIIRAGRLDKTIKIDYPQSEDRLQIFETYLKNIDHNLNEEAKIEINTNMNGFSGADIVQLLREAVIQNQINKSPIISKHDLQQILQEMQPSGLKDIILQIPKVFWSDIGGNEQIKSEIQQVIEWPLKHPEAFKRMGITPSKGVLLYGPPGCSKTMIAKAIATESNLNFLAIKGPELFSKYVGDSEKAIRSLFKRARLYSPSILFFDEIDAIASSRSESTDVHDRVLLQLLTEMDGIENLSQVIVIAATNRPDTLDKALTRPGRFDQMVYVGLPDFESRIQILKLTVDKMACNWKEYEQLAEWLNGYSGAEIVQVCREAGLQALRRDLENGIVGKEDFIKALTKVKPRVTKELVDYYKNFEQAQKLV